jgi:hypothetical protein
MAQIANLRQRGNRGRYRGYSGHDCRVKAMEPLPTGHGDGPALAIDLVARNKTRSSYRRQHVAEIWVSRQQIAHLVCDEHRTSPPRWGNQ